jgi:hypothetical protein
VRMRLLAMSLEERKLVTGESHRELIRTLVELSWSRTSFGDASSSLALLAEAETES